MIYVGPVRMAGWQPLVTFPAVDSSRFRDARLELRAFLVACHKAAVSIETMSRQLGFDQESIRSELIPGLETWTAAQRGPGETLPPGGLA